MNQHFLQQYVYNKLDTLLHICKSRFMKECDIYIESSLDELPLVKYVMVVTTYVYGKSGNVQ